MTAINELKETSPMDLGDLLDAGEGAVVTLVAGETRLAAHRAVLAARSPVFEAMFVHDTQEAKSSQVTITDVEGAVLRQLVAYMYSLQVPQLPSMASQLLAAADKYQVPGLKAKCEKLVAQELAVENAAATAVLATRHSCPELMDAAMNFIKANLQVMTTQGWEDAVYNQPEVVLKVTRVLADAPPETRTPATAEDRPTPGTNHQPHSDHSGQTPVPAALPTPPCDAPLPEDDAVSHMRSLSGEERGTQLILAAKEGAVEEVRALLAAGADVGVRDSFLNTPLHWAAYNGHTAVVRLLAATSVDINIRGQNGRTPLHRAAQRGHSEAAAALLEAGAHRDSRDDGGYTPLDAARRNNQHHVIDMLT